MTYICIYYIVYTNISKIKLIFGWPRNVLLIKNSRFLPQFFDDFKRKRVLTQRVLKYQFELVIFSSSIEVQYFGSRIFIVIFQIYKYIHKSLPPYNDVPSEKCWGKKLLQLQDFRNDTLIIFHDNFLFNLQNTTHKEDVI